MDDRERGSGVGECLKLMEGIEITEQRLALGDFQVDDHLIFERKTLADLSASIIDGRLFSQAKRLAVSPTQTVLIIEGTSADLSAIGMRREAIQGALISISLIFGIPVLRSMSSEESARLIVYASTQVREVVDGAVLRHGYRPKGKRKLQINILQGLPEIGPTRAKRLLERFGSVESVLNADVSQLIKVSGIGQHTAEKMRWAVSESRGSYLAGETDPVL